MKKNEKMKEKITSYTCIFAALLFSFFPLRFSICAIKLDFSIRTIQSSPFNINSFFLEKTIPIHNQFEHIPSLYVIQYGSFYTNARNSPSNLDFKTLKNYYISLLKSQAREESSRFVEISLVQEQSCIFGLIIDVFLSDSHFGMSFFGSKTISLVTTVPYLFTHDQFELHSL